MHILQLLRLLRWFVAWMVLGSGAVVAYFALNNGGGRQWWWLVALRIVPMVRADWLQLLEMVEKQIVAELVAGWWQI